MLKKCIGVRRGKSVTGSTSNCSIYLFDGYAQLNLLITPGFFCYLSGRKEKKGWSYLFLLSLNFSVYRMLWDENTPVLGKMHLSIGLCEMYIPYVLWNQILTWILHCHLSIWLFQRIFHKQVLTLFQYVTTLLLFKQMLKLYFQLFIFFIVIVIPVNIHGIN